MCNRFVFTNYTLITLIEFKLIHASSQEVNDVTMVANVLKVSVSNLVVIVLTDIKENIVMLKSTNVKVLLVQMVCICYINATST